MSLSERGDRVLLGTYRQQPVAAVHGEGAWVETAAGERYLDFISGVAVSALGHGHPRLVEALRDQAGRILHMSNLYWIDSQVQLAELIVGACFADRVFFGNSGAEANEGAIKLARRKAWLAGEHTRVKIVATDGGFHGRTLAMLAAGGKASNREGFGPMPGGFVHVPYGDAEALASAVDEQTAAVFLEPIQGEGGVVVPPAGYLAEARRLCDERGALLIFDEVQVGIGRTGRMFAHEHEGVTPDIMTIAKGLGGGLPISAFVCRDELNDVLTPGTHATTFGGNYLQCRAGVVVMETLLADGFMTQVAEAGDALKRGLEAVCERSSWAAGVRGRGLLLGIEVADDVSAGDLVHACRAAGLLVGSATDRVLRFAPPLIIGAPEIDFCLEALASL